MDEVPANQTNQGTKKRKLRIGGFVQANPLFVSQLATVAGQLLGTALKEEQRGTGQMFANRGRGYYGRRGTRPNFGFAPAKWQKKEK
ncbi:hypothetical protein niasHS_008718 [Heterodera schachtii]|uniref:Uncharacterized protein n=1 Tax=Heterodera schachtii TaxID=97005 RepID=A0ABD2J7J7_HETSC